MIGPALGAALERAQAAFERGDLLAVLPAIEEGSRLCALAAAGGDPPSPAELERLAALHARGAAAARAELERLRGAIAQVGSARRAMGAYGR